MRFRTLLTGTAKLHAAFFLAFALTACGGGESIGGGTTPPGGPGPEPEVPEPAIANLVIVPSATELDSGAALDGGVVLTAVARDGDNLVIPGVSFAWAATSGALVVAGEKATLTTGGDPAPRAITVQATAGGRTGSVSVNVVTAPQTPVYRMGTLNGATFQTAAVDVSTPSLAAGGTTGLRVNIVDVGNGNQLINQAVTVNFNSPCLSAGSAEITSGAPGLGTVTATYRAKGCAGTDTITASAVAPNGAALTASGTVTIAADSTGAIEFISASPSMIGIAGTGIPETSTLVFKVVNSSGGPVQNATVDFELTAVSGALHTALSATQAVTAADGRASVTVVSGSAPGTVRVRATADGKTALSSALVVTTGLTVLKHYSLSMQCQNVEAWSIDGVQVPVTIRMGDRYSNWPPPGTAAYFSTTGGTIGAANGDNACLTGALEDAETAGTCSVVWRSQQPRPVNGRVTITATSEGEDGSGTIGNPIQISAAGTLIMSGSGALIAPADIKVEPDGALVEDLLTVTAGSVATLKLLVRDARDQPMPAGTTITMSVDGAGSVSGTSSWTVPCMDDDGELGNTYTFRIKANDTAASGSVEIQITSPSGVITPLSFTLLVV